MAHALGYLSGVERVDPNALEPVGVNRFHPRAILCALLLAVFPGASLRAQPAGPPPVRFTVFAAKPIANLTFAPRPNTPPQKLQFFPTARSARAEYRGPMPLRFTDAESGAVVAEATIPPGLTDVLLLFSPLPAAPKSGGLRHQVAVLDDSLARHAAGGLAIINLSGLALSGTVNQENVTLAPGLNPTLAVGRSATIALRTQFKGRTYQSYAGSAALKAGERALLILFPPFYAGSLEVQSRLLVDQPGAAAKKADAAKKR
jgi:hypothetical protein